MSDIGWIKLHRQLQESPLWHSEPFSKAQAWIDLIMLMNHEDKKILFDNKLIEVKRGQHMTSYRKLSVNWKWSIGKVKRFIELLVDDNMVKVEHFKNGTLITLVNYGLYQGEQNTNETPIDTHIDTPTDTQTEHRRNADGTLTETNKNEKNDKNEKNNTPPNPLMGEGEKSKRFIPPSVEEVKTYCDERGNNISPGEFIDFYQSKGWMIGKDKMKDWKASIRTWERKRGFTPKPKQTETSLKEPQTDPNAGLDKCVIVNEDESNWDEFVKDKDAHPFEDGWRTNDDGYWCKV